MNRRPATASMNDEKTVRVRFAPSPTGSLHVGGARTALYNWLKARQSGGTFVVRIEDTDQARSTRASEESMLDDLRWLGLDWDEGPGVDGAVGPYRQSERGAIYTEMAAKLIASGTAYPCFCTEEELDAQRKAVEAKGDNFVYPGTWRDADPEVVKEKLAANEPHVVRFKVQPGARVEIDDLVRGSVAWDAESTVGDFILLRSNGVPVYNFCVAVDDATMGITHVVRAEEHLTNTLRQGLVLAALGFKMPQYAHASLILGEDRSKLSKRHGATSVDQFRAEGFLREAMINYLAGLGWNDGTDKEIYSVEEVIEAFRLDRVVKAPSMFDMAKLKWVNGQHIRALDPLKLRALLEPVLVEAPGLLVAPPSEIFASAVVSNTQDKVELLNECVGIVKQVLAYPLLETVASGEASELLEDDFKSLAMAVLESYDKGEIPAPSADFGGEFKSFVKALGKAQGRKGKRLFHPLRLALTGSMSGPDVGAQVELLAASEGIVSSELLVPLSSRMETLRTWVAAE